MVTWGSGGIAPPFLTPALDGNGWSISCPWGKKPLGPFGWEIDLTPEPVWML
jgi:hypothetical protein